MQNHNFQIKPSIKYCLFLGVCLVASAIVVIAAQAALWMKIVIMLLLAGYGSYTFIRYALLRNKLSITNIEYTDNNEWLVTTPSGTVAAELKGDSTITHFLAIMRFKNKDDGSMNSCILLSDSLPAGDFRRLVGLVRMS